MKRIGYLYEKVVTYENVSTALENAIANKKQRAVVKYVMEHKEEVIKELMDNPKVTGEYRIKTVIDRASEKERLLHIPDIKDLIRQHQLMQVLLPIMQKSYYEHSYGAIKGRGFMKSSAYLKTLLQDRIKGKCYYIKLDIIKFYQNIDQKVLKDKFRYIIKDERVLDLIDTIIDSYGNGKGIPIGNYTSQSFANFYLTDLDHRIKEVIKVPYYIRYMDDIVLISPNKRELIKQLKEIINILENELKLKVHKDRMRILKVDDNGGFIDFCGFKHYKNYTTIRKRTFKRIRKLVYKMSHYLTLKWARSFMSYWGYILRSNSIKLQRMYMPLINMSNMRKLISEGGY